MQKTLNSGARDESLLTLTKTDAISPYGFQNVCIEKDWPRFMRNPVNERVSGHVQSVRTYPLNKPARYVKFGYLWILLIKNYNYI